MAVFAPTPVKAATPASVWAVTPASTVNASWTTVRTTLASMAETARTLATASSVSVRGASTASSARTRHCPVELILVRTEGLARSRRTLTSAPVSLDTRATTAT